MTSSESRFILQDVPVVYMTDHRAHWEDFRKAIKEASVLWAFKGWITTVLRGGVRWNQLQEAHMLEAFEGKQIIKIEGEAKVAADALNTQVHRVLHITARDEEFFQIDAEFVCTNTWLVESTLPPPPLFRMDLSNIFQRTNTWLVEDAKSGQHAASYGPGC